MAMTPDEAQAALFVIIMVAIGIALIGLIAPKEEKPKKRPWK